MCIRERSKKYRYENCYWRALVKKLVILLNPDRSLINGSVGKSSPVEEILKFANT